MKKILIFPLLRSMPSGHHQVADAICETVYANSREIECKKMDILSEWNPVIEGGIVKAYLQWIRHFPESYAWTYRKFAYRSKSERPHKAYEMLFMKKVKKILAREKPDLIVCTHGFPSLFINRLKEAGQCNIPALNIYTDFFINDVWGSSHIDYHFVPRLAIKEELSAKYNIAESHIFITGIPISRQFEALTRSAEKHAEPPYRILMSGGSVGLGNISALLYSGQDKPDCRVNVLCGANQELFEEVQQLEGHFATAYPYISSKKEMDALYEQSDAIISKPGGVTVSEALRKQVPIFISNALPGQEQVNLQLLNDMGLVFIIPEGADALEYTCRTLGDDEKIRRYHQTVSEYRDGLELQEPDDLYRIIESMLERG